MRVVRGRSWVVYGPSLILYVCFGLSMRSVSREIDKEVDLRKVLNHSVWLEYFYGIHEQGST